MSILKNRNDTYAESIKILVDRIYRYRSRCFGTLLIGLGSFLFCTFSEIIPAQNIAACFWPHSGWTIALTVVFGPWVLIGVAAGSFAAAFFYPSPHIPIYVTLLSATFEPLIVAVVLKRLIGSMNPLTSVKSVVKFIFSSFVGWTITASASGFLIFIGSNAQVESFWNTTSSWWIGNSLGTITLAPLLLAWFYNFKISSRNCIPCAGVMAVIVSGTYITFWSGILPPAQQVVGLYFCSIVNILGAVVMDKRGALTCASVLGLGAVYATNYGSGPLAINEFNTSMIPLYGFAVVQFLIGMFLSVIKEENQSTKEKLVKAYQDSENLVVLRTHQLTNANRNLSVQHSKRLKVEADLVKNLRRFKIISDLSPVGIFHTDMDGQLDFLNEYLLNIIGCCQSDLLRVKWTHMSVESDRNDLERKSQNEDQSWKACKSEFRIRCKDNTFRWVYAETKLDTTQDGHFIGIFGAITDITESHALSQELKKSETRLRNLTIQQRLALTETDTANKAKNLFIANISHEIRTPLAAITGFSDILHKEKSIADKKKALYLESIHRNSLHLSKLIDEVLYLSKMESGKLEVERIKFNPIKEIESIVSTLKLEAESKNIYLESEFLGRIPDSIISDPTRFNQILINVIGNAVKFTSKGGVTVSVSLEQLNHLEYLVVTIRDTGCGIPKKNLNSLFEPFSQADTASSHKFKGTGLGLALSRRIAILLRGEVALVESKLGVGTTMEIRIATNLTIENSPDVVPAEPSELNANDPSLREDVLKNVHILLIEDGIDNQILFTHLLQSAGATIDIASDGIEGEKMALYKPYNIVLTDIQMPRQDGYQTTMNLRKAGLNIPIIALSARAMSEEREQCISAGCDCYIAKPVTRKKLIETVHFWCADKLITSENNSISLRQTSNALTGRP